MFEFWSERLVAWRRTVVDVEELFKVSRQIKNALQRDGGWKRWKGKFASKFYCFCGHSSGPRDASRGPTGRPFVEELQLLKTEGRQGEEEQEVDCNNSIVSLICKLPLELRCPVSREEEGGGTFKRP